jgi:hypothetical protein
MRVLAGVGAWLLGVGAATASSLLAVSLLGQGIATGTSQQLTAVAVNRALAAEASDSPGVVPATTSAPSPAPSATPSYQAQVSRTTRPQTGAGAAGPGHQVAPGGLAQPAAHGRRRAGLDRAHLAGRDRGGRLRSGRRVPGVVEPGAGL